MDKKKSTNYKREFNARAYDRLYITVNKGRKEEIETAAQAVGDSLNSYVTKAIDEKMKRQNKNAVPVSMRTYRRQTNKRPAT